MSAEQAISFDPKTQSLSCSGYWQLQRLKELETALQAINLPLDGTLQIDGALISRLDTGGALLLVKLQKKFQASFNHFSCTHQQLLDIVASKLSQNLSLPTPTPVAFSKRMEILFFKKTRAFIDFLSFAGELSVIAMKGLCKPQYWRLSNLASIVESAGFDALIIIALLSLMIGVVITYQMGLQLKTYGANIYIVDLLGLSILREFAPLITAIMISGRTGSAFTAQLGSMTINQEIDALNTMGIRPSSLLLLPKIVGLCLALPLLTIWADVFGILGGIFMSGNMLGITWYHFLHRFQMVVSLTSLMIGLGKAPIFALIISSIGCYEGMKVERNADSVGKQTTKSVVLSIFCILIADALFSILFSKLQL